MSAGPASHLAARLAALRAHGEARRFVRFLAVGVLNTGVGYGLYALLHLAGLPPQGALALAFAAGVAWNYLAHARLVFGTRGFRRLPAYVLAYLAIYLGNALALAGLTAAGLPPLLAQAAILPVVAGASFLLVGAALTGTLPFRPPREAGRTGRIPGSPDA